MTGVLQRGKIKQVRYLAQTKVETTGKEKVKGASSRTLNMGVTDNANIQVNTDDAFTERTVH